MASYVKSLKDNRGNLIIPRTTAKVTTFDNSSSGLSSTNTQDAIDEMMGKGWISSDDSIPTDPVTINADALGGIPAANYATNESVNDKISALDANSVNAANKDLSNLIDYQKALANLGARPNQNLWDNWYFVGGGSQSGYGNFPINQKGKQLYDQADGNCIDRHYKSSGAVVELLGDCLKVTLKMDGAPNRFAHIFSADLISGTTYTISFLVKSITSDVNVFVQENGGEFTTPGTGKIARPGIFSVTFKCTKTARYQAILSNESGLETEFELIACGMHAWSSQLLAYNESNQWNIFEKPDYGETLALCQRQLYIPATGTASTYYSAVINPTSGDIFFPVILPVPMRATPVITVYQATLYVGNEQKTVTPSAVTCYGLRGNQAMCRANGVVAGASAKTGIVEIGGLQVVSEL